LTKPGVRRFLPWLTTALVVLVLIPVVFPVFWIVVSSLKTNAETHTVPPRILPTVWTLAPYKEIFARGNFAHYMYNSMISALLTTILGVLVAAWCGYGFARFKFRGKGFLMAFVLAAQSFPRMLMVIPYFRAVNALNLTDTYTSLVVAYSSFIFPFCTWMLKAYFEQIPRELEEAALVDGCTRYSAFYRIILPLARPALAATAIFAFLTGWNEYDFALVLTSRERVRPIAVAIASYMGEFSTEWNRIMAAAAVATIPVVIIFFFLQKQLVQGLTKGAVKG
jgi:multiple sugar transport system permease protein